MVSFTFRLGATFISARRPRMARMASMTISMASSSSRKFRSSRHTGQGLVMMKPPSCPAMWGRAW